MTLQVLEERLSDAMDRESCVLHPKGRSRGKKVVPVHAKSSASKAKPSKKRAAEGAMCRQHRRPSPNVSKRILTTLTVLGIADDESVHSSDEDEYSLARSPSTLAKRAKADR